MKEQEIDRLFQKKLKKLESTPSAQAWQQLESQLKQKHQSRKGLWLPAAAAAVLLLLGIWGSLEYSSSFIPQEPLARNQQIEQEHKPAEAKQIPAETEAIAQEQPLNKKAAAKSAEAAKPKAEQPSFSPATSQKPTKEEVITEIARKEEKKQEEAVPEMPIAVAKLPEAAAREIPKPQLEPAQLASAPENIIISYKADKMEAEQPQETQDQNLNVKEFTGRRVLGFLKKVKENSSGSLAEFREAKDELLSLNFRSK